MTFRNKGVLITGASRGLGKELAREFLRRGSRVAVVARREEALFETVRELSPLGPVHGLSFDLAGDGEVDRLALAAQSVIGPIDILVNNASTLGSVPLRPLLDTSSLSFDEVLRVNLLAPFRLTRIIAGNMVLRGGGTVVHISSDAATRAYPNWGAYGVSKAALDHLSRSWAAELGDSSLLSVSFDPGEMDTVMHSDAVPDADPESLRRPADVARVLVQRLAELSPKQGGQREEVAA